MTPALVRPAPAPALAAQAREAVQPYAGGGPWDRPYAFTIWAWDGTRLSARVLSMIDPAVKPDAYPDLVKRIAAEDYDCCPEPAYAYQLTMEGFGVNGPRPGAGPGERLLARLDSRDRTYHKLIDRFELAISMIADVHGRLFQAVTDRARPGVIDESRYRPGQHPRGRVADALVTAGQVTGNLAYGYPAAPLTRTGVTRG